jgi:gliding motility-associated-like protein
LPAGTYTVTLIDPNGLEWEQVVVVAGPPLLTAGLAPASNYFGFGVSCAGGTDGALQATAAGGVGGYAYQWSNGQSGTSLLSNLPAGAYALTVVDANGCTATAAQTLNEPPPLFGQIETEQADCNNDNTLTVSQISGGIPPYLISLDGGPFGNQQQFASLSPGLHQITVEDAVACTWSADAFLNEAPVYWADLGPDALIFLGSNLTLQLQTNIFPIDTIIWNPLPPGAACSNCVSINVAPQVSTVYSVIVRGVDGCEATADVLISVQRQQDFFTPNIISPNFDGINDLFLIFAGSSVRRIRDLRIYDRWGGKVFDRKDFPPNDPAYGWDGRKDGAPVTEGVYLYQFELEYIDGLVLLIAGDVTVVR